MKCTGAPNAGDSEEVSSKMLLQVMRDKNPNVHPIITAIKCLRTEEDVKQFMKEMEAEIRANPSTPAEAMDNINGSLAFLLGHHSQETQDLWFAAHPAMKRGKHG